MLVRSPLGIGVWSPEGDATNSPRRKPWENMSRESFLPLPGQCFRAHSAKTLAWKGVNMTGCRSASPGYARGCWLLRPSGSVALAATGMTNG